MSKVLTVWLRIEAPSSTGSQVELLLPLQQATTGKISPIFHFPYFNPATWLYSILVLSLFILQVLKK
jgi:hypothetical protein